VDDGKSPGIRRCKNWTQQRWNGKWRRRSEGCANSTGHCEQRPDRSGRGLQDGDVVLLLPGVKTDMSGMRDLGCRVADTGIEILKKYFEIVG
jgi:hypothetical protein